MTFYSDRKESKEAIWPANDQISKSYKLSLKPPDNLLSGNRISRYTDNNNNKSKSSKLPWIILNSVAQFPNKEQKWCLNPIREGQVKLYIVML
ncbi:hypothetical protein DY000_02027623 [Brassica cretica]|uniref:Uncharacterized protein n=1 Tax=Brassica cretica TaxID=69181 RepID=A0ABQ7E5J9_BRACR|nr:hypothetical protein DY000_02027623 [Brassica cretica]